MQTLLLLPDPKSNKETIKALARSVKDKYENYAKINNKGIF